MTRPFLPTRRTAPSATGNATVSRSDAPCALMDNHANPHQTHLCDHTCSSAFACTVVTRGAGVCIETDIFLLSGSIHCSYPETGTGRQPIIETHPVRSALPEGHDKRSNHPAYLSLLCYAASVPHKLKIGCKPLFLSHPLCFSASLTTDTYDLCDTHTTYIKCRVSLSFSAFSFPKSVQ